MNNQVNNIYVCCPGDSVTGGPELLHQLVDKLRENGKPAYILYYPFENTFNIPDAYEHYNVEQIKKEKCIDGIVIFPEERTNFIDMFDGLDIYIWWLSVDSYFGKSSRTNGKSYYKYIKRLLNGRSKPIWVLKKYKHLVQSEYARLFLKKYGVGSAYLTDYLNEAHFGHVADESLKKNKIAYNPKKGYKITSRLIAENPEIDFVPLQNMTSAEVAEVLRESKLYIDFGSHPGKDRFPREAAMAGCCIITGVAGSAANNVDIPISAIYKLNDKRSDFSESFKNIVNGIFDDYATHSSNFNNYREKIKLERSKFESQVKEIFS